MKPYGRIPRRHEVTKRTKADSSEGLDYARDLYKLLLDWYKNADLKAQVLLTLDGVFLTFLTGFIFTKPEEASKLFAAFTTPIWLVLVAMCVCLTGSIFSALSCLWSRLYLPWRISSVLKDAGIIPSEKKIYLLKDVQIIPSEEKIYPPQSLGFFQFISHFQKDQYREQLKTLDYEVEMEILAFQIIEVSKNVTQKHFWVDCGFFSAGLGLFFFLLAGGLYAWTV
jgi:hypothetical protein